MTRYLLARVGWALFTIWAVVTATFFIYSVLPEDPARVIAGPQARPADVARIRTQLGLDRPLHVRYAKFVGGLVKLGPGKPGDGTLSLGVARIDLGTSYLKQKPVVDLMKKALPATLLLGLMALAIELCLGTLAGTIAAARRGTPLDWGTVGLTLLGISAPTFLIGLLLQTIFARELMLLPLDGYGKTFGAQLRSAILPAFTLGLYGAAWDTRLVRDELIGVLGQDYVRTARAKGQRELWVLVRHALRNALMPLFTVLGLSLGGLVGGAIVTEKIFRWPGIGSLSVDAIVERDGPVIMGVVLLFSTVVVLSNLLVDVGYALVDPRVRRR
jgi:peptide/nickel transport system permease protein